MTREVDRRAAAGHAPAQTRPWLALGSTLAVQMLASLVLAVPSVLAPAVAPTLGLAPEGVGTFVGLAYLAAMLTGLWSGPGVARIGAVRLSQCAMLACAAGAIAAPVGSAAVLLASAVVIGAGYGIVNPASTTLLDRHSPPNRRALFFSLKQTGVPLGVALAGLLMPWLLLAVGWRTAALAAGLACVALGLALSPAVARLEPLRARKAASRTHDAVPVAEDAGGHDTSQAPVRSGVAITSVLRDPVLLRLSLTSLAFACTQLGFVTFVVSLLNLQLGHSLAWSAALLAATQVVSTVARIALGYVADRWVDSGRLLGVLGIAMALSYVALWALDESTTGIRVMAAVAFCAATAMGWNGVFLAELTRTVDRRVDLAAVSGAAQFFTFAGSMSGPVLFGAVVRAGGSYSLGYLLLAVLPAVAGVAMLRAERPRVRR